jgi:hypothetical protein
VVAVSVFPGLLGSGMKKQRAVLRRTKGCLRSNHVPLPLGSKAMWELLTPVVFAVSRQDSRCFRHS